MKKMILTGSALLAFVAASYAQNTATIRQSNGMGDLNGATSTTSAYNVAAINQIGTGHTATVNQQPGADANAERNRATAVQQGIEQTATISQNNASQNNGAAITQTGSTAGGGNVATVKQNDQSYANQASIGQLGTSLFADVEQNGVAAGVYGSGGNRAAVTQTGDTHAGFIMQNAGANGGSSLNQAVISQAGVTGAQEATIEQIDVSVGNVATVEQAGAANTASVFQGEVALTNQAIINQAGVGGEASVEQTMGSAAATATIWQSGSINRALIYQYGGTANRVVVDQTTTGANNLAVVYQADGAVSDNNATTITQRGTVNTAYVDLLGTNNVAGLTQTGGNNLIRGIPSISQYANYAGQYGNDNTLTVNQVSATGGSGQTANVSQQGSRNTTIITQTNN